MLAAFLASPLAAAERIYVGQLNPAQVQMFSYDPIGETFSREDFDPGDADPATPLRSSVEFFGLNATADTFLLAVPTINTLGLARHRRVAGERRARLFLPDPA